MGEISLPYEWEPRDYQKPAWDSWLNGCNRQLLVWHRRAGKDDINLRQHAVGAFNRVGTYWHMLPQYAQARKAIWDAVNPKSGKRRIDEAFPHQIRASTRDNDMFIRFKNGSTWQLVGSDNYDALVGTPPVGLTASEWALADPTAWGYLSPILAENGGWASFITTPRGGNHVKKMVEMHKANPAWFVQTLTVEDTRAVALSVIEDQRQEYEALFGKAIADLLIQQEFYCSFNGAMIGAYWGAELAEAERQGRVKTFDIDPRYPVHTVWDLGKAVNNPIWCFQTIPGEPGPRIVDFYRPDSEDLEDWCIWLNERGYHGTDYVPHDIMQPVWGTKRTRFDLLKDKGRKPKMVGRVSVADGINAGRATIKVATFYEGDDERGQRMETGFEGLKNYRREWDSDLKTFRDNPFKDWSEHIGSSWRYLGLAWREGQQDVPPPPKKDQPVYEAKANGIIVSNMTIKEQIDAMIKRKKRAS
ncbi:hypothetical protein [Rhizobium sp. YTU87027]|uniref:hypothetical protein n=1 Tax=Rhizobium sp. YTU87027 TaxID=3417741 RepID=UPI003D68E941